MNGNIRFRFHRKKSAKKQKKSCVKLVL
jgi:hypothetical protein